MRCPTAEAFCRPRALFRLWQSPLPPLRRQTTGNVAASINGRNGIVVSTIDVVTQPRAGCRSGAYATVCWTPADLSVSAGDRISMADSDGNQPLELLTGRQDFARRQLSPMSPSRSRFRIAAGAIYGTYSRMPRLGDYESEHHDFGRKFGGQRLSHRQRLDRGLSLRPS